MELISSVSYSVLTDEWELVNTEVTDLVFVSNTEKVNIPFNYVL
jgi:hypothetical protein